MDRRLHSLCVMMNLYETPAARAAIGCAIEVHSVLGSGLLESTYERCFAHELTLRGIQFRRQLTLPITYKGIELDGAYRIDFLIHDGPLIEIKAVERLLPIHTAQVLTYLKLLKLRHGLIINFNVPRLKNGIRSVLAREEWSQLPHQERASTVTMKC